jgi:hypothetical protein
VAVIRLLVVNGCSFTRGAELADPPTQAWPALVGRWLGADVVNLARDGASNRRIVRTSVACIDRICTERGVSPDEAIALITWTSQPRTEFFSLEDEPEGVPRPADLAVDDHWRRIGPWRAARGHAASTAFYDHLWSESGQLVNFFLDWVMLDAFLGSSGYQARYAYAFPARVGPDEPAMPLVDMLPAERVYGGVPPTDGSAFHEMAAAYPRGPTGHPLEAAHAAFAQGLCDWMARSSAS